MKQLTLLLPVVLTGLFLSGCAISQNLRVDDNSSRTRGFYSIEGDVEVGENARFGAVKLVSGEISVGKGSTTGSLANVDGDIELDDSVTVKGGLKSVAGDIEIDDDCVVYGSIRTIAGDVDIEQSEVHGDVKILAGDLEIEETEIHGSIIRMKVGNNGQGEIETEIEIGAHSVVGKIIVKDKPESVRIQIHDTARVGRIIGYDEDLIEWVSE